MSDINQVENHPTIHKSILDFEVLIHKVGPLLIFDDGPRVGERVGPDRSPEGGAAADVCVWQQHPGEQQQHAAAKVII